MNRYAISLYLHFLLGLSLHGANAFQPSPARSLRNPGLSTHIKPYKHVVSCDSLVLSTSTRLFSKKKGGVTSTASGKIQVKLLKHVAGTGQAGQVIMVTPAFFNNKLRPTQSAKIISDEEVEREQKEAEQREKEAIATAEALQAEISKLTLKFARKAGPDGHLFGGINTKMIITELQGNLDDKTDFLGQKQVKITEISDDKGTKLKGDIKHTGKFSSTISLRNDVSAQFEILVESEV